MPIHIVSQLISNSTSLDSYGPAAAALISLILLKRWSAGTPLLDRLQINDDFLQQNGSKSAIQDLHGKTFIVSGGLTPYGLTILSNLSNLGCQLICLTQTSQVSHPEILQLIQLLRDGTSNQNIFAEHCSLTDPSSIDSFVEKWNKGNSSIPGERPTLRRLDGIVFLGEEHSSGNKEGFRIEINGRVKFLEKMLDNLLKQPKERQVRIVSSISPWYPAGIDLLQDELKKSSFLDQVMDEKFTSTSTSKSQSQTTSSPSLKQRKKNPTSTSKTSTSHLQPFSSSSSSNASRLRIDGSATLSWLLLSASLQRRLDEISSKDNRPSHSLYEAFGGVGDAGQEKDSGIKDHLGRDIQPPMNRNRMRNNINILNVCEGFERNRDVIDYILPRKRKSNIEDRGAEEDQAVGMGETDEDSEEEKKVSGIDNKDIEETVSNPSIKLKESIDPRFKSQNPTQSKSRNSTSTQNLQSVSTSPSSNPISNLVKYLLVIVLFPIIWLFSKSPSSASQSLIWSILSPISDLSQGGNLELEERILKTSQETESNSTEQEVKKKAREMKLIPGELYREGKIVALSLPAILLENGSIIPSTSSPPSTSYSSSRTPTALPISSVPTEVLAKLWEQELKK